MFFNYYKLFLALFANIVNFLETFVFFEGLLFSFFKLRQDFRPGLLFPTSMATHSSVLTWRIPGMVESGGLPSMGSHRVGHD